MQTLLAPLVEAREHNGVGIRFISAPPGDAKTSLIIKVPQIAVNILRSKSSAIVIVMPDLYPRNKVFKHETFEQLQSGILKRFDAELGRKGIQDDRLKERFKVFCFKHDLEALLLAAEEMKGS